MASLSGFRRRLLVSAMLAVWSWVITALLLGYSSIAQFDAPPGMEAPSALELFRHYVVLDFGTSFVIAPQTDALSVVTRNLGSSVQVLALSLVFAGILTGIALLLVRRGYGSAVHRVGYIGAVPAPVWALLFLVSDVVPTSGPASSGLVGSIGPALALSIPLAGFGSRVAGRTVEPAENRSIALESWLLVNWLVGGVAAVSVAMGRPGVGQYLLTGVQNGDVAVFAAAAGVLTVPLVLVSVLREYYWVEGSGGEPPGAFPMPSDRRAVVGLVTLLVVALASLGAGVLGSPAQGSRTLTSVVPGALFQVAAAVLVAGLVALGLGIPLGALTERVGRDGGGVLDATTNVPMLVLLFVFVTGFGAGFFPLDGWDVGLVVGIVTAPVVGKRTTRTFDEGYGVREAIPVGGTVAALGGAFAAFLAVDVAVLRVGLPDVSWLLLQGVRGLGPLAAVLLVTTVPPIAALLVSEGLYPSTE